MEHEWLKDYLDENNEVCLIVNYDIITTKKCIFKFIYENNKISSLVLENGVIYKRIVETIGDLEFEREVNLRELHFIPLLYKERIKLSGPEYGIHGNIAFNLSHRKNSWEPIGRISSINPLFS